MLFSKLLSHIKPFISVETHRAMTQHLESLGIVNIGSEKMEKSKMAHIFDCLW